ncbi:MAG TPA: RDD family protein [Acidimicrobiales bacterium]|nr:RDD family protein [Acidimicrobiales bacterium]
MATEAYAPEYQLGVPPEDPTKALWRRIFAYIVDSFVGSLIVLVVFFAFAEVDTIDAPDCPDDLPSGRACIDASSDDTDDVDIVLFDVGAGVAAGGVGLLYVLLNSVVLQGTTGATGGKFLTGARVVKDDGSYPPGMGRAFIRTILLIVDGINLILPLGLWVAMFSRGHRRIGDMAANTYVVKARYAGRPLPPYVTGR